MTKRVACICEGGAERASLELLLDKHKLIFEREDLIDEEVLKVRNASIFQQRYLGKGFESPITLYRILDSRRENFKLSPQYKQKVQVKNVITAPEIEMLIIINEGKYSDYDKVKSHTKPSEYCKSCLGYKNVKQYDFVKTYFADAEDLINVLHIYRQKTKKRDDEMTIYDLLK